MKNLNKEQKAALVGVMQRASQIAADLMDLKQTCIDCAHFKESSEICTLANQRPPARTIANGCESFSNNEPF